MNVETLNINPFSDEQVQCIKTEKNRLSLIKNVQWRRYPNPTSPSNSHTYTCVYIYMIIKGKLCA